MDSTKILIFLRKIDWAYFSFSCFYREEDVHVELHEGGRGSESFTLLAYIEAVPVILFRQEVASIKRISTCTAQ